MAKIEVLTFEYEECAECSNVIDVPTKVEGKWKWRCGKTNRIIKEIRGKIPEFCPLPDKEE